MFTLGGVRTHDLRLDRREYRRSTTTDMINLSTCVFSHIHTVVQSARAPNRGDVCWQVSNSWGHTMHHLRSSSSSKNQVMLALMPTVLFASCSLMHVWLLVQVVAKARWF